MRNALGALAFGTVLLGGCVAGTGGPVGTAVSVGYGTGDFYDGYYDDYYGPFSDGYWGTDNYFWYTDSRHAWHRDEGRHFRRDTGGEHFHHVHGSGTRREH